MKTIIVIPARYASTRFPGKPLALIHGQSMLSHTVETAKKTNLPVYVTTEDDRIAALCHDINEECLMTSPDCPTGSDRVLAAAKQLTAPPDVVINLQGDAPFTPPEFIHAIVDAFQHNLNYDVVTPIHRLSWSDLDALREAKKTTPFTGTTAVIDSQGKALWFSKNILPAIRQENRTEPYSPVHQHIGLYGFKLQALEQFCALPCGHYEQIEGLEQLRLIENGMHLQTVTVANNSHHVPSGIASPEE